MIKSTRDPVLEVRCNREQLLKEYGGIDGLHQYMDEEREKLIEQGWRFVSAEEVWGKKQEVQGLRA